MGKEQKSSTQNTFPPWLMNALRPLIEQQTQNMGTFSNQGFNVLQGLDYRDAAKGGTRSVPVGNPKINPGDLEVLLGGNK